MLDIKIPKNSCNSHLHIIDPSYPNDGKAEAQKGSIKEYKKLAKKYNLDRAIFVQAKTFGFDNSAQLDAVKEFGGLKSRAIIVTEKNYLKDNIKKLNEKGAIGVRFSLWNPKNSVTTINDCYEISEIIKDYGWNIQLHISPQQLIDYKDIILKIKSKIVLDHMARLSSKFYKDTDEFKFVTKLIDKGNTWVKISGPYLNSKEEYPWNDLIKITRNLISYAPERMLWGSDFPHITEKIKPKEESIIETIEMWFKNENEKNLALVKNPQEVYRFKN